MYVYSVYITYKQLEEQVNILRIMQNAGVPIYQQIAEQFKEDILTGKYKQGEFLPSIRSLAKDLRISVITTIKAYEELEKQGLVTAVQGKGYYVNAQDSEMLKEQHMRKMEEHLLNAISAAKIAGVSGSELADILKMLIETEDDWH